MSNFDFTKTLLSGNKQYIDKITNDIAEKANNPDWNNLKNRPFYEEPTETSILSGTYEFEMWADFYGSTLPYTELTIGVIYDVIFDGITYSNLECRASENPDIKSYLGSSYDELLNDNHEYNFTIYQEVEFFTVYTTSTESSHSIEIIEKESTIKTLDSKYIPAEFITEKEASGTADSKVSEHNTSETSHSDIRLLIEGLTTRLNALADSDDTTLDQMSEVVAYIKSNKTLIEAITTNKVSVSDIVDNLTTSASNKPLSAKQGVALKALIDAIVVPKKTSQLTNDSGFLTEHQDISGLAPKATTLSGYGITDGATKEQFNQLSEENAELKGDLVYRTSSAIAQLNMTDGTILKKDGGKEEYETWATSNMIDVNGCKYIRVKGIFNNLSESSNYTHVVFYNHPEISSDYKVSYVTLAEDEMNTVDVTLEIPSEANYFAICNSVANKGSVSVEKYYENLVVSDLSNLIDLTSVIVGKDITVNGLTLHFNNNEVTFNGTTTTNTTFLVYSSNNQNLLKNGTEYIVDFKPLNGNKNVYLQMFNNMTSNALVNGQMANNQLVKIPENANDVFIRFIAFAGTYNNIKYHFSVKRKVDYYSNIHINSASELYEFMKNPVPFTRLYLTAKEYDLYNGLFENDIANNAVFSEENFLHDVIIYGNNAKITLNIPSEVLNKKAEICNTYSCLNIRGNVEVNDLECVAKNCRYVLHEESLDNPLWFHTKHSYNNCKFSYLGCDYPTVNANTVGCGFSKGQIVEFVNCEFVNGTPTDYTFYVHGRDFNISRLSFDKCIFNNRENAFSLGLSQYTGNELKSNVLISNSYIGKINFFTQNNGLRNNQWFVKALNSYITQMNVDESTTLLYQPMVVNTISGLIN